MPRRSALVGRELRSASVSRALAAEIERAGLRSGEQLPPERELGERFSVSRDTVRRALEDLAADGVVERHRGRGTFVAGRRLSEEPDSLMSLTEMGAARGLVATAVVLEARTQDASVDDSELFSVAPGAPVLVLHRVRLLDAMPVSIDRSRVPVACLPPLDQLNFTVDSLYAALDRAGHGPVRADYTVQAVEAREDQAALLDIPAGGPLLLTRTTSRAANGRVVEAGEMAYRGDRYRFQASLTRRR